MKRILTRARTSEHDMETVLNDAIIKFKDIMKELYQDLVRIG